jgi:hypothetical protein
MEQAGGFKRWTKAQRGHPYFLHTQRASLYNKPLLKCPKVVSINTLSNRDRKGWLIFSNN